MLSPAFVTEPMAAFQQMHAIDLFLIGRRQRFVANATLKTQRKLILQPMVAVHIVLHTEGSYTQ
jgi:hypothetical protein